MAGENQAASPATEQTGQPRGTLKQQLGRALKGHIAHQIVTSARKQQGLAGARLPGERAARQEEQSSAAEEGVSGSPPVPASETEPQEDSIEPEGETPKPEKKVSQTVPYERFQAKVKREKELASELETLRRERDTLRKQVRAGTLDEEIREAIPPADDGDEDLVDDVRAAKISTAVSTKVVESALGNDMDELRQVALERRLQRELGEATTLTQRQLQQVVAIYDGANVTARDALILAKANHPDLFAGSKKAGGFDPAIHGTPGTKTASTTRKAESETPESKQQKIMQGMVDGKIDRKDGVAAIIKQRLSRFSTTKRQ